MEDSHRMPEKQDILTKLVNTVDRTEIGSGFYRRQ